MNLEGESQKMVGKVDSKRSTIIVQVVPNDILVARKRDNSSDDNKSPDSDIVNNRSIECYEKSLITLKSDINNLLVDKWFGYRTKYVEHKKDR